MSKKAELCAAIVRKQLGVSVSWEAMAPPPKLTSHYESTLKNYKRRLQDEIETAHAYLRPIEFDDLKEMYAVDGSHHEDDLRVVWNPIRQRLAFLDKVNPVFLAGLGNPRYAAEYEYWARMEWLTVDETLWLCVGLDPRADWEKALRLNNSTPPRDHRERAYMLSVREQLRRVAQSTGSVRSGFRGAALLDWVTATNFPAHPGFLACLRKIAERQSVQPTGTSIPGPQRTDPREVDSMARLLTAIAIREYGYRPDGKKSPIPRELQAICDEEGLAVSRETILKYLRIGARQRDED